MIRSRKINKRIELDIVEMFGDTSVRILLDNNPINVCKVRKTGESLGVGYVYDEKYLVIFSKDTNKDKNPLKVEAAFDLVNLMIVPITLKNEAIFEYMYLTKSKVSVAVPLQLLNAKNLNVVTCGEVEDFVQYITAGNNNIDIDAVKAYVLSVYPRLSEYTDIDKELTVKEYRKILSELNVDYCEFHIMPRLLTEF